MSRRIYLVCMALACACESAEAGSAGSVVLRADGGNEARDGISAERFADGYAVTYEHALLSVSAFHLRTSDGDSASLSMAPRVVDLVPRPVDVFRVDGVPAQRWDEVGFSSRPVTDDTENLGAPDGLVERMIDEGYSFFQTGFLQAPGGEKIPFELGLPVSIDYFTCTSGDGTFGIVVTPQGTAEAEITWHLTHFWFDSFAEDSAFRAEALAAVYDGEHPITIDMLAQQRLASLTGVDGEPLVDEFGSPVVYIPPQEPGVVTLRDFVVRARFGHFNGLGGSCTTELHVVADE